MKALLEGKTAVVTGASRGIGRDIAVMLAECGADVAIVARNQEKLEETADMVRKTGQTAYVLPCDLTDFSRVSKNFLKILKALSHIDIWVNNAAISRNKQPEEIDELEWDALMDVNLKATWLWTREVYMYMQHAGGGKIIHIASIGGQKGAKMNGAHYCASKGAIIAMSKALSLTGAPYHITSNAICPGLIETDMAKELGFNQEYINTVPLKRLGSGRDIAGAVVYLASELSEYVTGATIDVNGGLYLR